jgi:Fur family zinc uptake transcriptional regulator
MPKRRLKRENHRRVYAHLRKAGAPLTAYQILEAMRGDGFRAPVTIYRALQRLMSEGRVHRVESLNAFVPCCDPDRGHGEPVFAICRDCGAVREIMQAEVLDRLRKVAATIGFSVEQASVELKGRCSDCAAKSLAPDSTC